MKQGTEEWKAWRRPRIGGTAARVIMGVDPWQSAYELWAEMTGRAEPKPMNPAMLRGQALEAEARKAYEEHGGIIVQPTIAVHPEFPYLVASLDGRSFDGESICEVKCPGKDRHEEAAHTGVPEPYWVQVQHYLMVTGAAWCDYVSYHPESATPLIVLRVDANPGYHATLLKKERDWYELHIVQDEPPPKTARDVTERTDGEWIEAATLYRQAEAACVEWARKKEAAKDLLLSLTEGQPKVQGGGVLVTTFDVKGGLDWSGLMKECVAQKIDVEAYRKPGTTQTRITVQK